MRVVWLAAVLAVPLAAQPSAPPQNDVTAVFTDEAPRIDGVLEELLWTRIEPVDAFTQVWPDTGSPSTEATEVRIAYDRDNLYFAFRNLDANPELIRAQNLERGGRNDRDDHVYIGLDTYRDGRNAYLFEMNALGTQDDATVTDEGLTIDSFSWDAVYRSETVIDETGWTMEVSIPFRQLRFPEGDDLEFGLMLSRMINRKNERVMWPAIGLDRGSSFMALATVSQYGVLRGLRDIRRGRNLEIKPYGITGAQQSRPDLGIPTADAELSADAGVDIKYGITSNLTLDATVNTDFAQVEADNVQINLSRFSLFFPEKREFFLERSGLFEHGSARQTQTFFSRRIGLDESILAGARMTGQIGPLSVGVLNIETGPDIGDFLGSASTNNTVARVRTDILPRATVGGIVTNLADERGYNRAAGLDGQVRFGQNSIVDAWATQVWDTDPDLNSAAGSVFAQLATDRAGISAGYASVGSTYAPALGFVRRRDYRRVQSEAFYQHPLTSSALRRVGGNVDGTMYWGLDGERQSAETEIEGFVEFTGRDQIGGGVRHQIERLDAPFTIRENETVPIGEYGYVTAFVGGETDSSRPVFGSARLSTGGFFNGDRTDVSLNAGWRQSQHLVLEGGIDHSVIDLGNGPFTATVGSVSALTAFSRTLFGRTLLQYDNFSQALQANVRLNWIHTPGSDLFVVFNTSYGLIDDGEDPLDPRRTVVLRDRLAVAKLTYLVLL